MGRALLSSGLATIVLASTVLAETGSEQQVDHFPDPGVNQIMLAQGRFIRGAYNNEGYVILGYQVANMSVGEAWVLIEAGLTMQEGKPTYTLRRESISLDTPDGRTVPLASNAEFLRADLRGLQNMATGVGEPINYFPHGITRACYLAFFSDVDNKGLAYESVELDSTSACLGRLFFEVPGGLMYGQHWLNVKFENGLIRVPFRIMTKDEQKKVPKGFKAVSKPVRRAPAGTD